MAIPIEMPKLGNTVEECLLAKWLKQVGDPVAEGDIVAEIETDKATFELTSPAAGTLLGVFFNNGDTVTCFRQRLRFGDAGRKHRGIQAEEGGGAACCCGESRTGSGGRTTGRIGRRNALDCPGAGVPQPAGQAIRPGTRFPPRKSLPGRAPAEEFWNATSNSSIGSRRAFPRWPGNFFRMGTNSDGRRLFRMIS